MEDNKLGAFIREKRGSMSLREFAKLCKISHTHLDSIERGSDPRTGKPVRVTTETLKNLADGMGQDFLELAALAENMDFEKIKERISNHKNFKFYLFVSDQQKIDASEKINYLFLPENDMVKKWLNVPPALKKHRYIAID